MKSDIKKIIITNLPYLLFVWLFGKVGEAWRLAAGADASQKLVHLLDSLAAAFANGLPSLHPFDLCKPRLSCGHFIRTAHETCLFATRGKAPVKFHSQPSFIFAPQQEHSHKPEEQFAIIERLSDGPYLELFARRRQPGWDCWGFEAPGGSDLVIPGYPVPVYSDKVSKPDNRKEV